VAAGVVPLIVGGDDAIPPVVGRGLAALRRVHVLHIDAHLDFRDEVDGVREGYSSPIRRLREQAWIGEIVQVGLRGVGSARRAEVEAARRAGNRLVTARELHERGAQEIVRTLGADAPWFVTIDCDGLDPSIAPGVGYPEPDGLTFHEAATFVRALARDGRIAAIELTEYRPALDLRQLTALTILRLLTSVISLAPSRDGRPRWAAT
jgi:agmatinase